MKKLKVAALLMCFVAFSFAMTSCQKAEDLIIGKWKLVKVVDNGRTYTEGEEIGSIWEFKADNTLTMGMEYAGQSINVPGTYTIDGDKLTMTVYGEIQTMNIDKITKSKMILSDPDKPEDTAEFEKQ